MRHVAAVLVLFASSAVLAQEPTTPAVTFRAGALYLHKSAPHDDVILSDISVSFPGIPILNANQFDFGWEPGWEVAAEVALTPTLAIEARYFQVDGWNDDLSVNPLPLAVSITSAPGNLFINVGATDAATTYQSLLRSAEFNGRLRISEALNLLAGFRYLMVDESLGMAFNFGGVLSNAVFKTENDLFGVQVGFDVHRTLGRVDLQASGKAGVYGNNSEAHFNAGGTLLSRGRDSHLAFAGEVSAGATYRVTDRISVQAGYQLLWLDGVALASDQPAGTSFDGTTDIAHNTAFYHGAYVGFGVRW